MEGRDACTKNDVNVRGEGQMTNCEWCTCMNEGGMQLV